MEKLADSMNLVPDDDLATLRKVSKRALANERARGAGPPYVKIGRRVFYPRDGLQKFLARQLVTPSKAPTLVHGKRKSAAK